jgi:hypothetical protein
MLALYRKLLRLYPAAYFREYGGEMTLVFAQAQADTREKTLGARVSFCFREVTGLLVGAVRLRFCGPGDWSGMRRFDMHPEFRFPRSTVVLMSVILAGVVLAIDKAKDIVRMKEGLPSEIHAVWDSLLWWLLFAPLLILAAVGVGWGILFALGRTGMHRLEKVQTWPEQP